MRTVFSLILLLAILTLGFSQSLPRMAVPGTEICIAIRNSSDPCEGMPTMDTFDDYNTPISVLGLNGGCFWGGGYAVTERFNFTALDFFDTYSAPVSISGLNGGIGWSTWWGYKLNPLGIKAIDDFEDYTPTETVEGLNLGVGFDGPYAL